MTLMRTDKILFQHSPQALLCKRARGWTPSRSFQIWLFIRIISAKSTPGWQTPHPFIWSKRDKKRAGTRRMWCPSSWKQPPPCVTLHEGSLSCRLHACTRSCIFPIFTLPAPVLRGFAHYVTMKNPAWRLVAKVSASVTICGLAQLHQTQRAAPDPPEHLKHLLKLSAASSLSHTHTIRVKTVPLYLTFSKLRTHSRTFLLMSVSIGHRRAGRGANWHPNG